MSCFICLIFLITIDNQLITSHLGEPPRNFSILSAIDIGASSSSLTQPLPPQKKEVDILKTATSDREYLSKPSFLVKKTESIFVAPWRVLKSQPRPTPTELPKQTSPRPINASICNFRRAPSTSLQCQPYELVEASPVGTPCCKSQTNHCWIMFPDVQQLDTPPKKRKSYSKVFNKTTYCMYTLQCRFNKNIM